MLHESCIMLKRRTPATQRRRTHPSGPSFLPRLQVVALAAATLLVSLIVASSIPPSVHHHLLSVLPNILPVSGLCADPAWRASFAATFAASEAANSRAPNRTHKSWAPLLTTTGYLQAADFTCLPGACPPLKPLLKRWKSQTPTWAVIVYARCGPTANQFLVVREQFQKRVRVSCVPRTFG